MLGSFNALCDYRPTLSTPNVRVAMTVIAIPNPILNSKSVPIAENITPASTNTPTPIPIAFKHPAFSDLSELGAAEDLLLESLSELPLKALYYK